MSIAGWMRSQRERPIAEHERRAAMLAVAVLLGAVALLLTLTQPASQARRATEQIEHDVPATAPADQPVGAIATQARKNAEGFLAGYLGYAYGHTPARQIEDASPSLIRSLESEPVRVSPVARARRPRVLALHLTVTQNTNGEVRATAVVNDGGLIDYTIGLTLAPNNGRLLVTGLEGA